MNDCYEVTIALEAKINVISFIENAAVTTHTREKLLAELSKIDGVDWRVTTVVARKKERGF